MNKTNKKTIISAIGIFLLLLISLVSINSLKNNVKENTNNMEATVLSISDGLVTLQDKDNVIYTFNIDDIDVPLGTNIAIEYTGLLDKNKDIQDGKIVSYTTMKSETDENGIPSEWLDNGVFSNYYILAYDKLKKMSLDDKIGQLFLVRYPEFNQIEDLKKYKFGGFVFFERDFKNKTEQEVKDMIKKLQNNSNIPLLTAVDEEGGNVVRVSSNPNLAPKKFPSSSELYNSGGLDAIKNDTIEKSKILSNLGLNLNLAPVVDVTTSRDDYMYDRALQQDTKTTSDFAKTVIEASKNTGVSYTLKHFPGYGNNTDTHSGASTDSRSIEDIRKNDLPPFKSGIDVGAESILVSHNTVTSIDKDNPASLSTSIHNILRSELGFTGIIITDDLDMGAVSTIDDAVTKAILAGNDLIITTDYEKDIAKVRDAVSKGTISTNQIDKLAFKVIAWKYYKGMLFETK